MQAQKNKIAPISVLYLLCTSRLSVLLTSSQAEGAVDLSGVLSALAAIPVILLLSLPIFYCNKYGKTPFDNKAISVSYGVYFVFLGALNVYRFSLFTAFSLGDNLNIFFFGAILLICAVYSATLGIEGFSRFSAMAFLMLISGITIALLLNIPNADLKNAVPFELSAKSFLKEGALFSLSGSELAVLFFVFPYVNGKSGKYFSLSVILSLVFTALVLIMSMLVLGNGTKYFEYPLFTLFQTAGISALSHIEVMFTAVFCFGIFVKLTLLIFCACECFKCSSKRTSVFLTAGLCAAGFLLIYFLFGRTPYKAPYFIAPFIIFCVIIPLFTLIFGKRKVEDSFEKL